MKVPLLVYSGDKTIHVVTNSKLAEYALPFLPYIQYPDREGLLTYNLIPTGDKITVSNREYKSILAADNDSYQMARNKVAYHYLKYHEQLFIDQEDYILNYPNTDELKVLSHDIEVLSYGDGLFPRASHNPIVAIGAKFNNEDIILFNNYSDDPDIQDVNLISDFLDYVNLKDPDIIQGYNSKSFDIPYIIERCKIKNLNYNKLTRFNSNIFNKKNEIVIKNRIHFDLLDHVLKDQTLCYDKDTEVLTENGWKLFKNVSKLENIATLNKNTDTLEYQLPTRLQCYTYSGKMYKIKSKSVDLLVTKNHDLFVKMQININNYIKKDRTKSESIWEFKTPSDVFHKKYNVKKNVKNWIGNQEKNFILPKINRSKMEFNYQKNTIFKMTDWLEFLGYYISEGCTFKDKNTGIYSISISQSMKYPENVKKIRNCIHRMGFSTNYYHKEYLNKNKKLIHTGSINFKSKQLYLYLQQFGKSKDKFIPRDILKLNKNLLTILFNALMLGDGTKSKKRITGYYTTEVYSTISKQLADDVQEIIIKLGFASALHLEIRKPFQIYRVMKLRQDKPGINRKNRIQDSWVEYNDNVYCCSVPNQIILIRKNGNPVWCGNSGIKSHKMKTVAEWKKIPNIIDLDDHEIKNTYKLWKENPDRLNKYLTSDINITHILAKPYLNNAISLAEFVKAPLENIINGYSSFIPKLISARRLKDIGYVALDRNHERYNEQTGKYFQTGFTYQGAIVAINKKGYFPKIYKVDFSSQ